MCGKIRIHFCRVIFSIVLSPNFDSNMKAVEEMKIQDKTVVSQKEDLKIESEEEKVIEKEDQTESCEDSLQEMSEEEYELEDLNESNPE